jgi:sterol-4alpha-carboxylate 3-dehydrogenase (decarboxylating)
MDAGSVLVTGGAGLLGRALVRELLEPARDAGPPVPEIRVFDVRSFDAGSLPGVVAIQGDVRSLDALRCACRGVSAVVHAASLVDYGHASEKTLEAINVGGTRNVIRACRETGVRALVYTSSMDAVLGSEPIRDGDESLPYPDDFADAYARSKARAEQAALGANGAALRTCALRPGGMYGEADPYHVSGALRLLEKRGLPARLGDGSAVFQHVYVGNVAHAHALALRQLVAPDPKIAGKAYFVTDHPAVNFFDFLERLLVPLGFSLPPRSRRLPYPVAYGLGALLEVGAKLIRPVASFQPAITRSSVRVVCKDMSFLGDRAARDLGYAPVYSEDDAIARTVEWFREHGPVDPPRISEGE